MPVSFTDSKVDFFTQRIYDAALDDGLWPQLMLELAQAVNASDSMLFGAPNAENYHPFMLSPSAAMDSDAWNAYASYFWRHDVWEIGARQQDLAKTGCIFHGDQFIARKAFRNTEMYCDFFKPMLDGIGVVITGIIENSTPDDSPPLLLSFYKSAFSEAFTADNEGLIRALLPHFRRALSIRRKINGERELRELRESALDQLGYAVILLDLSGRITFANRKAERMLSREGDPTLKNGRFEYRSAASRTAVNRALRQAQAGVGSMLRLENAPPIGSRVLTITPLSARTSEQLPSPARILVAISELNQPPAGDFSTFSQLYRLTTTETRVLQQLLLQQSPKEVAEALHVGIETVRTHLSALFAKTQTRSQGELIRFCMSHPQLPEQGDEITT